MKIIFLFLLGAVALATHAAQVDEGVIVSKKYLGLMRSQPDLTIDHVKSDHFELYGPTGMIKWLEDNNIPYSARIPDARHFLNYPTSAQTAQDLKQLAAKYPQIVSIFSIGKTVVGHDLLVMKISDNVVQDESEPEFKYIANMHGDEIVGRELMVRLIEDLLTNYGKDPAITQLVDTTEIYIMPSMNPDGADNRTRGNSNGIDLNRDFPDFTTNDNNNTPAGRATETKAVMKWQGTRQFALSANFHGGAEVVNYPWDTQPGKHPKYELIKGFSLDYARLAPYIYSSTEFRNGITNGYDWYEVNGGMQDWSWYWYNDLQITIEVSEIKWADYSSVDYYYQQNRKAMLDYIGKVHRAL